MPVSPAQCVIRAFGSIRKTARAVGRQPGAVAQWRKDGFVPSRMQAVILRLAHAGRVSITAEQLILGDEAPVDGTGSPVR